MKALHRLQMTLRSHLVGNDLAYWYRPEVYRSRAAPDMWRRRAATAAAFIAPENSVLDLGCGEMQLREFLPANCPYVPADQVRWSEDVVVVDLNRGEFPAGTFDFVVLLGVIEYLRDPVAVLTRARRSSAHLVASYCHPRGSGKAIPRRRMSRMINDFSESEFADLLAQAGWVQ